MTERICERFDDVTAARRRADELAQTIGDAFVVVESSISQSDPGVVRWFVEDEPNASFLRVGESIVYRATPNRRPKLSPGRGGLGTRANAGRCAVEGCFQTPKPHVCPADGSRHGHGAIHYEHCHTELTFRSGGWFWICDEHYAVCVNARRRWAEKR